MYCGCNPMLVAILSTSCPSTVLVIHGYGYLYKQFLCISNRSNAFTLSYRDILHAFLRLLFRPSQSFPLINAACSWRFPKVAGPSSVQSNQYVSSSFLSYGKYIFFVCLWSYFHLVSGIFKKLNLTLIY